MVLTDLKPGQGQYKWKLQIISLMDIVAKNPKQDNSAVAHKQTKKQLIGCISGLQ